MKWVGGQGVLTILTKAPIINAADDYSNAPADGKRSCRALREPCHFQHLSQLWKLHAPAALHGRLREYEQARLTGQHCSCSAIFKCIRRCYTFSASHHHSRHHPVDSDIQHLSRLIWSTTSQAVHINREILHVCMTYFVYEGGLGRGQEVALQQPIKRSMQA